MKKHKIIKRIVCSALVILVIIGAITCSNNIYLSNKKIIEYYHNNSAALNEYMKTFDENSPVKKFVDHFGDEVILDESDTRLFYEIPDSLSESGIAEIKHCNNNYLFFEFEPVTGFYYNYIYYSKDGTPSEKCPSYFEEYDEEKYKFRDVGNGIFVSGKKNDGVDWYKTERIEGNWYYCEIHA